MERAIIHSNLKKEDIQPRKMLNRYYSLLKNDIYNHFPKSSLNDYSCPVNGKNDLLFSFKTLGMEYKESQSTGNIFLSPRPNFDNLKNFYYKSEARTYWLKELWPSTNDIRKEKVILPYTEWVTGFMNEYGSSGFNNICEYLPNHWGYLNSFRKILPNTNYNMIDPLFDINLPKKDIELPILMNLDHSSQDAVLLFEALDRSHDPNNLLENVKKVLRPDGLCFLTCLLASGFESKVLGEKSEIFVPPERMNIFTYEGMNMLIEKVGGFEILEFSTPGVLDVLNVINKLDEVENNSFFDYIFTVREDKELVKSFLSFLQMNRLGAFGRIVLKKN